MTDWFKKLFAEPQTLFVIITSGLVGLFIGIAQGVVQKRHGGWGGFFAAIAKAAVVAVVTGLAIHGFVPSETARFAIVGVCTMVSDDIWEGLKTLGAGLRVDPLGFIVRVLDAVRGRQPSARAMTAQPVQFTPPTEGAPLAPVDATALDGENPQ